MTTWADVAKGDRVRMGEKVYDVAKAKRHGKKVDVVLTLGGARFASTVKAKAEVETVAEPLRTEAGAQRRWATREEAEREVARPLLSPGDPALTSPPEKPHGPKWGAPRDEVEAMLGETLGAHLVAELANGVEGYYVPPVDETTVQAHLALFHERKIIPSDVVTALAEHDEEHRRAEANATLLTINHWHTKRRPEHG